MQSTTDQISSPATTIDLTELHFTPEEIDAVRRGLTIALTEQHRERPDARAEVR